MASPSGNRSEHVPGSAFELVMTLIRKVRPRWLATALEWLVGWGSVVIVAAAVVTSLVAVFGPRHSAGPVPSPASLLAIESEVWIDVLVSDARQDAIQNGFLVGLAPPVDTERTVRLDRDVVPFVAARQQGVLAEVQNAEADEPSRWRRTYRVRSTLREDVSESVGVGDLGTPGVLIATTRADEPVTLRVSPAGACVVYGVYSNGSRAILFVTSDLNDAWESRRFEWPGYDGTSLVIEPKSFRPLDPAAVYTPSATVAPSP